MCWIQLLLSENSNALTKIFTDQNQSELANSLLSPKNFKIFACKNQSYYEIEEIWSFQVQIYIFSHYFIIFIKSKKNSTIFNLRWLIMTKN